MTMHPQPQATISERVAALEQKAKALDELCGEILQSLRINLRMETLITIDDRTFERMLNNWSDRHRAAI